MTVFTDLAKLLEPESVAIVGASENLESISGRPLKLLRRFGYGGRIYPVNPKHDEIDGLTCYRDLESLPEVPDVVLIGVRAKIVPEIVEQCNVLSVPFAVIFSSGFAESEDYKGQNRLMAAVQRGPTRVLGPNCQGLVNFVSGIPLSFSASLDTEKWAKGHVAYVSQSGAFGYASFAMAAERGVGFRYVVTTGNQTDLDVVDFGDAFLEDPEVRLLVLYLEGIKTGSRLIGLLKKAEKKGIPVAVLKVGGSPTGQEAAKSHTAAVTGDRVVWETVLKQYGAMEIDDVEDIVDLGKVFGVLPRAGGNRLGILTTSGGAGIIMADRAWEKGLQVPELSPGVRSKIEKYIPSFGSSRNPVDLTAQVINEPEGFSECVRTVLESPETDMVVVVLSMITGASGKKLADDIIDISAVSEKPMAVCWLIDKEHGGTFLSLLRNAGIPLFQSPRRCAGALARLTEGDKSPDGECEPKPAQKKPLAGLLPETPTEYDAKRLLAEYGVSVTQERLCGSLSEALGAAEEIGYPVALKIMSPDIIHKTEAGIVSLNLNSEEEVRNAYGRLMERAGKAVPGATIQGVLIQEMVTGGVECMIGVKRDPLFGPVVVAGLGGIYVEILQDLALRHAPVNKKAAMTMLSELKGYPLLAGARGRSRLDIESLADTIVRISSLACNEEELQELDVNPVFVFEQGKGVKAVDAVVVRRGSA
ncbi:MAG: acetate--CoA ligase family protein [Thermovirgaceae bacterium]